MRKLVALAIVAALLLGTSCRTTRKTKPAGVVVLSPEVAEIICALGGENEITGVTEECNYPGSLKAKPKVGNFSSINREAILALNPALVFCSSLEQEGMAAELSKLGIRVEVVYPTSLEQLSKEITRIGTLTGREKAATALNTEMRSAINDIQHNAAGKIRPRVYLEIYRNPLMSVADSSFVGELIETAGGDNIFSTLERDYARVNPEAVIKAKPEIMICYSQDTWTGISSRKGWSEIPAVKRHQILFESDLDPDLLQRATPRCIEGMRKLQQYFEHWRNL